MEKDLIDVQNRTWKDARTYSKILTHLEQIEKDIEIMKINSLEGLKDILEVYDPQVERMEKIYGESAVTEYINKRKNIADLIGEIDGKR